MIPPSATEVRLACEAMRTRFEILLSERDRATADLHAAGEEALAEIVRVESWLSAYRPDSILYLLNHRAASEPVLVDARIFSLLQTAQIFTENTQGTFDMTVRPLLTLWGLTGSTPDTLPTPEAVEVARQSVGMSHVVHLNAEDRTVSFQHPNTQLDPGAIGKGYALDRATDLLREAGITTALLHGGTSTIATLGGAWQIALQHPLHSDQILTTVSLTDSALSVSAVHGKTFYAQGRQFGHILDPRTGYPVTDNLLAAVIAPSATATDALSTALLVGGIALLPTLTAHYPEAGFLLAVSESSGKSGVQLHTAGTISEILLETI
jgi:thiamine biosynthesis lipoprotein